MPTTTEATVRGIDITTYLVKDAARAKAFYRDVMGLPLAFEYGESGAEFTFPDNTTFGIWKMSDGSWNPGSGIMFAVDDVRKAVEHYKSKGVKFEEHIEDSPVCFMAFGEDSEGNSFILHQRKGGRD
ncbi:MAG: VOC family protein [Candidatus Eremiobacteraeota bacterium]|nr:VOC family protein [Candidatus Eremiobacteraeota bacterium]MBV8355873.1 VOC family protein [Candidatus Eremiobacteraeota bacterium]